MGDRPLVRTVGGLPVGRAAGAEADECEILCAVLERMDQPAAPGQAVIADKSYFGAAFQDQLTRAGAHAGAGPARVSGFRGRRNCIGRLRRAGESAVCRRGVSPAARLLCASYGRGGARAGSGQRRRGASEPAAVGFRVAPRRLVGPSSLLKRVRNG